MSSFREKTKMKKTVCIQNFIERLDPNLIPKARLRRLKKGYSNKRIVEDFKAMMLDVEIQWEKSIPAFIVPYCNLAMNVGLGHGLGLVEVDYPQTGYFANPEHTLDETFVLTIGRMSR